MYICIYSCTYCYVLRRKLECHPLPVRYDGYYLLITRRNASIVVYIRTVRYLRTHIYMYIYRRLDAQFLTVYDEVTEPRLQKASKSSRCSS